MRRPKLDSHELAGAEKSRKEHHTYHVSSLYTNTSPSTCTLSMISATVAKMSWSTSPCTTPIWILLTICSLHKNQRTHPQARPSPSTSQRHARDRHLNPPHPPPHPGRGHVPLHHDRIHPRQVHIHCVYHPRTGVS